MRQLPTQRWFIGAVEVGSQGSSTCERQRGVGVGVALGGSLLGLPRLGNESENGLTTACIAAGDGEW